MNTKINYLYRDADNYKVHNECVVQGTISAEQVAVVLECLDEGEYFIVTIQDPPVPEALPTGPRLTGESQ